MPTSDPHNAAGQVVLVVEDDEGLALAISKILQREGHRTLTACTGAEALDRIEALPPALMLLDYSLSDTRADRLLGQLERNGRHVPFIVATGHGSETIAVEMMKRGARDYLVKGVSFLQLLPAVVARVLAEIATERRLARAEQALRESEERYRTLVESSPDAIFVGQRGNFVFVNAATVRLLGASSAEQLLGRNVLELVDAEFRPMVMDRMRQVYDERRSVPLMEERLVRLDGRAIEVEVLATPCVYDQQPSAQVVVRDISDRKRAQAQAREHQAQLAHVMRVNTMGKMVSELAHEINQPLYAIANYAAACRELLQAPGARAPTDVVRWVEQIAEQANRAGEIIRHVGDFVRKEAPRRSSVSLNDLIRDIVRLLEIDARLRAARIQLSLQPEKRLVLADRVQIEQVVVNLVINAIDAMDQTDAADRQVTITTRFDHREAEVAVHDRGAGVSGDEFPQLFEPFFTTKLSGMGMGLAICRSIVEAHGGRLWATANEGRGMTFRFTLPAPPQAERAAEHSSEPEIAQH